MLPLLPLVIIFSGAYFLIKTRLFMPKRLRRGVRSLLKKGGDGGVSPLAALTVALAGTLGVGNIAGVAVAIMLGGAGAVFWMWAGAFFSMSLKYAETVLALRYRHIENGKSVGGPMYYIYNGLGKKRIARVFCVLCICSSLGSGCIIQSNSASAAIQLQYGISPIVTGCVLAVLCALIVLGGVKSISRFTLRFVPLMSMVFLALSVVIIVSNAKDALVSFFDIFACAFSVKSIGAGVTGLSVMNSIKQGMAKGSLSHEAGAGTSPISHAASNTKSPAEQGFLGIFEVFADTVVMCTVTALVILIALPRLPSLNPYDGISAAARAYGFFFGNTAYHIISVCVLFFAFATLICWSYYGICCVDFLTHDKKYSVLYLVLYCIFIVIGSVTAPEFMWDLTDFFTCALIFVNVPCVFALRREVAQETELYFRKEICAPLSDVVGKAM